jgi:O-antigen/teichoic acid export membrane protein
MRRLGVGSDIGLTAILQALAALGAFALQAIIVRSLSKDQAGLYFLTLSYVTIASGMADFGILAAIYPRLSVAKGGGSPAFRAGMVLRLLSMVFAWIVINIYLMIDGDWQIIGLVNVGYSSVVFSSRMSGIRQFFETLLRLQGRTYLLSLLALVDMAITILVIALLGYLHILNVFRAMVVITVGSIPGFIVLLWPALRYLRTATATAVRIPARYYRAVLVASLPLALFVFTGQVYAQLETLVIKSFLTLSAVSAYGAAVRPLVGTLFFAGVVAVGVVPIVAQSYVGSRPDVSIDYIVSVAVRIIALLGIGICAACNVFHDQIMLIFGRQYVAEGYILRIYSITNMLVFLVILFDQFLLIAGLRRQTLIGALLSFLLALVLELVLIRPYGIVGMMMAKLFSVLCLIVYQLWMLRRDVRRAALDGLRRLLLPAAALAIAIVVTDGLPLAVRAAAVFGLPLAVLGLTRALPVSDLLLLRTIRVDIGHSTA